MMSMWCHQNILNEKAADIITSLTWIVADMYFVKKASWHIEDGGHSLAGDYQFKVMAI